MTRPADSRPPRAAGGRGTVLDHREVRGARLTLRESGPDDLAEVRSLYDRLAETDRHLRFHGAAPDDAFLTRWLTCDASGVTLVVEVDAAEGLRVVAEGGFRGEGDDDVEFAITVDPVWRGGLGTWLVQHLQQLAHGRGHGRLAADVLSSNLAMRGLLERLGYATIDRPGERSMRVAVPTEGSTPGWSRHGRSRVLVEADGGGWFAEQALRDAGHEVAVCPGPGGRREPCPLLVGEPCLLVEGADVVLSVLRGTDGERVRAVHDAAGPDVHLLSRPADGAARGADAVVRAVAQALRQRADRADGAPEAQD